MLPPSANQSWPKSARLLRRPEFVRVQERGVRRSGRWLVVLRVVDGSSSGRFGLVVSRKVGGAVQRNRVRRHLREELRRVDRSVLPGAYVVIARVGASTAPGEALRRELAELLGRDVAASLRTSSGMPS